MTIDFVAIQREVEKGYISCERHPTDPLRIYNYTKKTQFDSRWNPSTITCRGLIVDAGNRVVARPFPKFFNFEEIKRSDLIWSKPFIVTAKLDGSLGILYQSSAGPAIATRGRFASRQAEKATEILKQKHPYIEVPAGRTALFEIIYPDNRIVCDYGDMEDLILLAVIDNNSGNDVTRNISDAAKLIGWKGSVVDEFDVTCKPQDVLEKLNLPQDGSVEGVVLRFDYPKSQYTRVKFKIAEYKRLHRLLTRTSPKDIWELLRAGSDLSEVLDRVPDEFYSWVRTVQTDILEDFRRIENRAKFEYRDFSDRRAAAAYFKTCTYPAIMFCMIDGKNYADIIWNIVKPKLES